MKKVHKIKQENNLVLDIITHGQQVAVLAMEIAETVGLDPGEKKALWISSLYHDIGKLNLEPWILFKKERLTEEEFRHVKDHVFYGCYFMRERNTLSDYATFVLLHHEYMNGEGYLKLSESSIPYITRILTICDVYGALRSDRPYRPAYTLDSALQIMEQEKEKFDQSLYKVFLDVIDKNYYQHSKNTKGEFI